MTDSCRNDAISLDDCSVVPLSCHDLLERVAWTSPPARRSPRVYCHQCYLSLVALALVLVLALALVLVLVDVATHY